MILSPLLIEDAVKAALKEDLGHGFDVTSQSLIPANASAKAVLRSREAGVLSGLIVALSAFSLTDVDFDMVIEAQDGDAIEAGQIIASIEGPARSLLMAERVALNFLGHMSGIASLTARYVELVKDTGAEICDTRKTLPGLRIFQKYAVYCGGGANHRFGLDDAILIKDNHIAAVGDIDQALDQAYMLAGHTKKIEIEVDTLEQLETVLANGKADIIMLDNFDIEALQKGVEMAQGAAILEASGGVTLDSVQKIAQTGVNYISIGALTHSAPNHDFGLDIDI
ncbi:MAG: nicotinate-nucleotide diphosphorylase (carboxylating) [Micavibrio sp.]|nr:nicotinate-nucleotide diphosphorylase (carboxylating) [Micavibrio sp.]|tara:strand:- start:8201 stop:9046 length:846 start_codon:yes stop_codon:yes gene_type:complete